MVQDKFRLDLSDEEAVHYMQSLIDESVHALFAAVVEQIHKFAQLGSFIHNLSLPPFASSFKTANVSHSVALLLKLSLRMLSRIEPCQCIGRYGLALLSKRERKTAKNPEQEEFPVHNS
ncbi:UNVERIFIED_CONTAM: hypothetical protein K2H54_068022 [Gekko kuhli]